MNRKLASPIHLALLALATIIPVFSLAPVNATTGAVSVNPNSNAADVGETFVVNVDLSGVTAVVGYDVTLLYNNNALNLVSVDFESTHTMFGRLGCAGHPASGGGCNFPLTNVASDSLGEVRSSYVLLGGVTTNSPGHLIVITFVVVGAQDSDLTLSDVSVIADIGNVATPVDVAVNSGSFFVPPTILFSSGLIINPNERVQHVKINPSHTGSMPIFCGVMLDPNALRAGFGGCQLDIFDPNGGDTSIVTDVVFMFPGQSANATGIFNYGSGATLGPYTVLATPLRCVAADISACILGSPTIGGLSFKINP